MTDIRNINFCGDDLTVVKMSDDNKIYVSIRSICSGLGLDENRVKHQRTKINNDPVLSLGKRIIKVPTAGGDQDKACLELDFIPIWLAKVNPATLPDKSMAQDKIIEYQLKAKDVLSKVFIHGQAVVPKEQVLDINLQQLPADTQALVMLVRGIAETQLEQQKHKQAINHLEKEVKSIKEVYSLSGVDNDWREKTNRIIASICTSLKDYSTPRHQIYDRLNERAHCNIRLRLANLQKRAVANGMAPSRASQLSKLDVIASDDVLKEIYVQIVKEFAIYHGYSKEDLEAM